MQICRDNLARALGKVRIGAWRGALYQRQSSTRADRSHCCCLGLAIRYHNQIVPRWAMGLMRRPFCIVCCMVIVTTQAWAAAFDDGVTAFDRGHFDTAIALWTPLAERGDVAAQLNLGVLFEKGLGVAQNYAEAARWYMKAAIEGDQQAQYNVAVMYEKGTGLPLDHDKARYWYEKVLANTSPDRASLTTKQRARARLGNLFAPEEVIPYGSGRFVLRRSWSGACVIALQGLVDRDANVKFDDAIKKASKVGCKKPLTLLLESPGGTLEDSVELGQEVRSEAIRTVARYECASGCGIIFLGGAERVLVGSRARIGFHQPALDFGTEKQCEHSDDGRIRRYLHFVVPAGADRILNMIRHTSCHSVKWVHGQLALELGVATSLESENVDVFGPEGGR